MQNKSTLSKIRKNQKNLFSIFVTTWEKNPCKNILFFKQFEESLIKVSDRSEKMLALVVLTVHSW